MKVPRRIISSFYYFYMIIPQLRSLLLYFLFFVVTALQSQVTFQRVPADLQMIPRLGGNSGNFTVTGVCGSTGFVGMKGRVFSENGTIFQEVDCPLGINGEFSLPHSIPARMEEFNLEIYAVDNQNHLSLAKKVKRLVAGDYILIGGQSNAVAGGFSNEEGLTIDSLYSNRYCRTIGTVFQSAVEVNHITQQVKYPIEQDCRYFEPSCQYFNDGITGCIGIWGMRVMHEVVSRTGIPACIVNNANGSTSIVEHYPSNIPSDPERLIHTPVPSVNINARPYDRLFKKLHANHVTEGVIAVLWYQGESDAISGRDSALNYNKRFAYLRSAWKTDYPNLQKIFVMQINTGCAGDDQSLLRESQRRLSDEFSDVVVMSAVGSAPEDRLWDGCHYTHMGYVNVGAKLGPVVAKYLYGANLDENEIMPPNVSSIYFTDKTEICIEFDKEVMVQQSQDYPTGTAFIKDYFYNEEKAALKLNSVRYSGNKVYLQLADEKTAVEKLTYLPDIFSNIPTVYMGPWILNARNPSVGAYSFAEVEVAEVPSNDVLIYPVPADHQLYVRSNGPAIEELVLYNARGGEVYRTASPDKKKTTLDVSGFEPGMYFLELRTNAGSFKRKVLVE